MCSVISGRGEMQASFMGHGLLKKASLSLSLLARGTAATTNQLPQVTNLPLMIPDRKTTLSFVPATELALGLFLVYQQWISMDQPSHAQSRSSGIYVQCQIIVILWYICTVSNLQLSLCRKQCTLIDLPVFQELRLNYKKYARLGLKQCLLN